MLDQIILGSGCAIILSTLLQNDMFMPWIQITLDIEAQYVERVSAQLTALGALAVTLQDAADQPLYEPPIQTTPLWQSTRISGLFAGDTDGAQLHAQLQAQLTDIALPSCQIELLPDQDWSRAYLAELKPLQINQRLWICPSWQPPPEPQAINIMLDPGLAFGTGNHPTTALCLEWLTHHPQLRGQIWLDYGCGSGILAIAALKLGATQVWVVDNEPQALLATQANAAKNAVEAQIQQGVPQQQVDGILANILAEPLMALAPQLSQWVRPKGFIVLSGILITQSAAVIEHYQPYCSLVEVVERQQWVRIVAQKL